MKKVSIVVPVYNEEENLREFHKRITEVMSKEPMITVSSSSTMVLLIIAL